MTKKIKLACPACGSDDITRDGVLRWSVEDQRWEAAGEFDQMDCAECGAEFHEAREIAVPGEPADLTAKRDAVWRATPKDYRALSDATFSPHWPDKSRTILLPIDFYGPGNGTVLACLDNLSEDDLDRLIERRPPPRILGDTKLLVDHSRGREAQLPTTWREFVANNVDGIGFDQFEDIKGGLEIDGFYEAGADGSSPEFVVRVA
jgi:predicted nucleic-acid-binding Zn-ribbon protein